MTKKRTSLGGEKEVLGPFIPRKQSAAYMRRELDHLYDHGLIKPRSAYINGPKLLSYIYGIV